MRVRVLGRVELDGADRSARPKERAVLTVLALSVGETVSAERLVDSLWGDDPPRTAIHTVRSYVSRLRDLMGREAISGRAGGYCLEVPADEVDTACFERRAREGHEALEAGDAAGAVGLLAGALGLWGGDPGADLAGVSASAGAVTRLVGIHRAAEEHWAQAVLALGGHGEHVSELERMALAEPLRELRWELLMVALYRSGRRAEALRAYAEARGHLVEELGIEPGLELRSLEGAMLREEPEVDARFARVDSGGDAGTAHVGLPPMLADAGPFAFVGREAERETLTRAWKHADDGLRVVWVSGEPGIGKTRLAIELAGEIHGEGGVVLGGRCDEGLGVPYQPFAEALRHYLGRSGTLPARTLGELGGELVRLEPRLSYLVPDLRPPLATDPASEQYRLFDAVALWLATLSVDAPVLLVLEDLHWATRPTLLLLRHLVRSSERLRLLVVATYRDTEIDQGDPVAVLLSELGREAGVDELALGGLDEDGVAAFLAAAAGGDLDEAGETLARAVYAGTEGNPLFVGEVLRHLAEAGAIYPHEGRWTSDLAVEEIGIPAGVRDVVRGRVARLSGDVNTMLATAAVAGAEFDVAVLEAILELDADVLIGALDEATTAGLLAEAGGRRPSYRFTHALVRAALYDELSAARRARTHRQVAEAIEQVHAASLDDHVTDLAYHYGEAATGGDTRTAVDYATRAGERALTQLAFDDATAWHSQALELFDRDPEHDDESLRCELLIALGDAQRQAGHPTHRQTLLDAAAIAEALGDTDRLARAAFASYRGLASRATLVDSDKVRVLEAALDAIGPADSPRRARLLTALSMELTPAGASEHARSLADEAVAVARRVGDPAVLIDALGTVLSAYPLPDGHELRAAAAAEMLELAPSVSDPRLRTLANGRGLEIAAEEGDLAEYERMLDECDRIAAESRGLVRLAYAAFYQVTLALLRGDLDEADRLADEALRLARSAGDPDAALLSSAQKMLVGTEREEFEALVHSTTAFLEDLPEFLYLRACLAWELAECGERDRARDELDTVVTQIQESLSSPGTAVSATVAAAALAAVALDDATAAKSLYPIMAPWDGYVIGIPTLVYYGPTARFLGLLATVLGRYSDAERHFTDSQSLCEDMGARSFLAHTNVGYARMLMGRNHTDDRAQARTLLEHSLTAAAEHGYRTIERHATELLAQLDEP